MPTRRSGWGWEGHLAGRNTRLAGTIQESVQEFLDGSRFQSGGLGEVGSPSVVLGGVRRTT